ncbi:beta strand repeat-containing protein [Candidatus Margulisiibacteriota bacterium]
MRLKRLGCIILLLALLSVNAWAATYTVSNCSDSGAGSLRQAISSANGNAGSDTIIFNIPSTEAGFTTIEAGAYYWKISVNTQLPTIESTGGDATIISGSSQASYLPAFSNAYGPEIMLDGSALGGNKANGLEFFAHNCTIEGLSIGNFPYTSTFSGIGIFLRGNYNTVLGCYIGLYPDGTQEATNDIYGVYVYTLSSYNKIGDGTASGRNVISGNGVTGVYLYTSTNSSNEVLGNYIGTNASGTAALSTAQNNGIQVTANSHHNVIGGSVTGEGNLISGNHPGISSGWGIDTNSSAGYNIILGNYIGTDLQGTAAVENFHGVVLGPYDQLGDGTAQGRNLISGNEYMVIRTNSNNKVMGNYIGTDVSGTAAIGNGYDVSGYNGISVQGSNNTIEGNVICGNGNFNTDNGSGIEIDGAYINNRIIGNYIGVDATGTARISNAEDGVHIRGGAKYNRIGGTAEGEGNVISGNEYQVYLYDSGTNSNEVLGNFIGTNASGTARIASSIGGPVLIYFGPLNGASFNKIGDGTANGRNIISCSNPGIRIDSNTNEVKGNYIGTDVNGTSGLGGSRGMDIGGNDNIIGGSNTGEGNVISGWSSGSGIYIGSISGLPSRNIVTGNLIGTDKWGSAEVSNWTGIVLNKGVYNRIGGSLEGEGNVISGNLTGGINIGSSSPPISNNEVIGNFIGTDRSGTLNLSNNDSGIKLNSNAAFTRIGPGNVIAYNGSTSSDHGILIDHSSAVNNTVTQNSIYENSGLGIKLENGGNNNLAAPTVLTALYNTPASTTATGAATANATIEVFLTNGPDSSGSGEGKTYLNSTIADGSGNWSLTLNNLTLHSTITATATDTNGNTSMFSWNKASGTAVPSVEVLAPSGGETWEVSAQENITWKAYAGHPISAIKIYYSFNGGATYETLVTNEANAAAYDGASGSYTWNIPSTPTTEALVSIECYSDVYAGTDESDAVFTISFPLLNITSLTVTREGDSVGSNIIISWATDPSGWVDVYRLTTSEATSSVYTSEASAWTLIFSETSSTSTVETSQVGTGYAQAYYKVIPAQRTDMLSTAEAAGKINVTAPLFPPDIELIAIPLIPSTTEITSVIGDQFNPGNAEVWSFYNAPTSGWRSHSYNGSSWGGSLPEGLMPLDRGYWIKSTTATKEITFVGSVPNADRDIGFNTETLFFYGNSFPVIVPWTSTGLNTIFDTNDQVWQWSDGWQSKIYDGGNTWSGSSLTGLMLRHGFWILKQSEAETWTYPKTY